LEIKWIGPDFGLQALDFQEFFLYSSLPKLQE
jgi:hypothetical protein